MVVIKIRIKGIENAIDYKDSGIFSDRNKTETNNTDYLVAGQAVDNMMVLEKQEKYSLSPKFAISGLQSIGNLISYDTSTGVAKHTDGTVIFKDATHIDGDFPDRRLSLMFGVENGELLYKNNPDDPMPIKTINMAGLQKWEETDDYIIYLDKDAVMTTVESYVTGTYDLFKERKADIDRSMELLRANDIEWTAEDDSKLILDINKAQLERIANTPVTMEEEDFAPQTFTTRAVPTTYECCFRVDKKSGEIYIGEGYENLLQFNNLPTSVGSGAIQPTHFTNEHVIITVNTNTAGNKWARVTTNNSVFVNGNSFALTYNQKSGGVERTEWLQIGTRHKGQCFGNFISGENSITKTLTEGEGGVVNIVYDSLKINEILEIKNLQITQTSTPKPFVKSIMPSGKLAFVTGATSESHSFVMKNLNATKRKPDNDHTYIFQTIKNGYLLTNKDANTNDSVIVSNFLSKYGHEDLYIESQSVGLILGKLRQTTNYSFKQLLIYKGNLTEEELKAENEKDINDFSWYYWDKSSVISNYLINGFSQCLVYSPALTDAEITEEIAKSIKLPETMAIGLK